VKKFLKVITILSGILMVLLIFLYAAAMIFVNRKMDKKMTPEMRADYEVFAKEKRHYDPADIYPEPFSDETIALADAFLDAWEKPATQDAYTSFSEVYETYCEELYEIEKAAFEMTASLKATTTTLDDVEVAARALRPLQEDWRQLVEQDDYMMELFDVIATTRYYSGMLNYFPFLAPKKYMNVLSYEVLRSLDESEVSAALDVLEFASLGIRNHHYDIHSGRSEKIRVYLDFYPLWYRAVHMSADAERLKKSLKVQKQMTLTDIYYPEGYRSLEYEEMSFVRQFSRFGIHKDVQDRTLIDISEEAFMEWPLDYYQKVLVPLVPGDKQEEITEKFTVDGFDKVIIILYPLLRPIGKKVLYVLSVERGYVDRNNSHEAFKNAQALSDILIMQTAARIYELENGAFPETAEALVPKYLDAVPMDVYTDRKQPYKRHGNRWYSIGSDGKDDKMGTNALGYYQSGLREPHSSGYWDDAVQPGDLFFGLPVKGE
jgi:hypothetical protein